MMTHIQTTLWSQVKTFGKLFYIVDRRETTFEQHEDVPDYVKDVIPFFFGLLILEQLIAYIKRKPVLNLNDAVTSVSQGIVEQMSKILLRGIEFVVYFWIYENYRLAALPWDSPWTWWICFLGVDMGYYWLHRASHEFNFMWGAHQVHHSSEYYNLTTALRQSAIQDYVTWIFYLPLAFFIPPSIFLVHTQFNLLFQFWIHTEVIDKIGPLEYILNTPSHHRVHHGRNRYSIDKNYAGVLIIWDRMFGTFQPEGEEVVYGLTHPINTFDTFEIQLCHYMHIWKTFWKTEGLKNKFSVLFKGPGWEPGKPRLGLIEDIPDIHAPMPKYNPVLSTWLNIYVGIHFIILTLGYIEISHRHMQFSQVTVLAAMFSIILSLTALGAIMDQRNYASCLECVRCILFTVIDVSTLPNDGSPDESSTRWIRYIVQLCFVLSSMFWIIQYAKTMKIHINKLKQN